MPRRQGAIDFNPLILQRVKRRSRVNFLADSKTEMIFVPAVPYRFLIGEQKQIGAPWTPITPRLRQGSGHNSTFRQNFASFFEVR